MPLLIDAIKLLPETANLRATKDNKIQEQKIQDLLQLNQNAKVLVGNVTALNRKIDENLLTILEDIRLKTWREKRTLPTDYELVHTCAGEKSDQFTVLNRLPKADTTQFRVLADLMNMVIFPVEYADINAIFKTQNNAWELQHHYNKVVKLLDTDHTTKYNVYMLAPIQYYNLWNHIKCQKDLPIYYPTALESVFTTIELMVPAQRNLYLATKANTDNIAKLATGLDNIEISLKTNIETINNKLENVINKVNVLEAKQFELQRQQQVKEEENKKLRRQLLTAEMYATRLHDLDPIMFVVPVDADITTDDVNTLIMMFWGADIDETIFKFKGITTKPNKANDPLYMDLRVDNLQLKIKDMYPTKLLQNLKPTDNRWYETQKIDGYQIKLYTSIVADTIKITGAKVYLYGKKILDIDLDLGFRTQDLPELMKKEYYAEQVAKVIYKQLYNNFDKNDFTITIDDFEN